MPSRSSSAFGMGPITMMPEAGSPAREYGRARAVFEIAAVECFQSCLQLSQRASAFGGKPCRRDGFDHRARRHLPQALSVRGRAAGAVRFLLLWRCGISRPGRLVLLGWLLLPRACRHAGFRLCGLLRGKLRKPIDRLILDQPINARICIKMQKGGSALERRGFAQCSWTRLLQHVGCEGGGPRCTLPLPRKGEEGRLESRRPLLDVVTFPRSAPAHARSTAVPRRSRSCPRRSAR